MVRYAELLETAFRTDSVVRVDRVNLAPRSSELRRYSRKLRNVVHHLTIMRRARRLSRRVVRDVYHVVDGSHAYVSRWLPSQKAVVTTHDVIPLLQATGHFSVEPPGRFAQWLIHRSLAGVNRSAKIIAVSQCTANDLIRLAKTPPERVIVIPLALSPLLCPDGKQALPSWDARNRCMPSFVLHVGNNGFYKNRFGAIRIFNRVRQHIPIHMKLVGPPPNEELCRFIQEQRLERLVEFIVDPDDITVAELYRTARLLLFPSIYEGFGWPPLEAMASHCPVVCTRAGSLAEVVGDAALIGDPQDEAGLAELCIRVLQDRTLADLIVAKGIARVQRFSLEKLRAQVSAVYRSLQSFSPTQG
jgi:glycosyltransferase involved in cell wall biosynthesis